MRKNALQLLHFFASVSISPLFGETDSNNCSTTLKTITFVTKWVVGYYLLNEVEDLLALKKVKAKGNKKKNSFCET